MKTYKLRAECPLDIARFIAQANGLLLAFQMTPSPLPDVEFTFSTALTLRQIRNLLNAIPDSHVMSQTLQPEPLYTGIRS